MSRQRTHECDMLPTSCNPFQGDTGAGAGGTISLFFGSSDNDEQPRAFDKRYGILSTSAVDCTLSLGTPSTRSHSHRAGKSTQLSSLQHHQLHDYSSLCCDFTSYQPKPTMSPAPTAVSSTAATLGTGTSSGLNSGGDTVLLARRCANCDTTSTPLWRNGPKGPKSLCNACGIRYKKEKKREASVSVACPSSPLSSMGYTLPRSTHLGPFSSQSQLQRCEAAYALHEQYRCGYPVSNRPLEHKGPSPSRGMVTTTLPGNHSWWLTVPIPQRVVEYCTSSFLQDYT